METAWDDPNGDQGAAAYRRRNGLLAERGDFLVAVWTGLEGGGTAETIAAARAPGLAATRAERSST